jgi:hypothetical protein
MTRTSFLVAATDDQASFKAEKERINTIKKINLNT